MSSLYKRANARQRRILRIVEGAVKNASHAHPELNVSDRTARSIAKRAAGTLTAQWPDVLAIQQPGSSDSQDGETGLSHPGPGKTTERDGSSGRGASQRSRRSPFPRLYKELSWRAGAAGHEGRIERRETLIEILRIIDKIERGL